MMLWERFDLNEWFVLLMLAVGYGAIGLLRISKRTVVLYITVWSAAGLFVQGVAEWIGMTHYQHGYRLEYNLIVFLIVQSITALWYMYVKKHRLYDSGAKELLVRIDSRKSRR
ncbi:hypothetical protein [Paenibacillus sp. YYML68]|uniref:hypothetical protein n=1 Tax=Paenibacillus sp. YYML68 TaxID=2909250 RepID=UPI0024918F88|nr:hypothetical protein [Paenibacillus sp. YYML68]